jgi:AAA family ATP:ADP antiporter
MTETDARGTTGPPGPLERALRLFSDVRAGEAGTVLLLFLNLFLLLVGYYILKTVREPLILATGGAEVKSYASAGQALVLMGFIPLYSWFSSRVDREKLVLGVSLFFILNIELFWVGSQLAVPYLGVAFFIWLGIFNMAAVAQFWSYANDLYARRAGERLFPVIAVGATAGSPIGAKAAQLLFEAGVSPYTMFQISAGILVVQLALYAVINRRETVVTGAGADTGRLSGPGGFALVFRSRYLRLIAALLIVLNIVNTTGEYIMSRSVVAQADAMAGGAAGFDKGAYIGSFYGGYFFGVNVAAVVIQAFLVSRIVRYFGIAGVVLIPAAVSLGAYGLIAAGAAFSALRWAKTAENATDYSVMNTARAMLWLPTTREEKYKAKQALDTFFVRAGDVLSATLVFLLAGQSRLGIRGFAALNAGLVLAWLGVAFVLLREHDRLVARQAETAAA